MSNAALETRLSPVSSTEFVLAALRCTSLRVRLIELEIIQIGIGLKHGLISPECAIDLCNEVAPGCLDVVSATMGETTGGGEQC